MSESPITLYRLQACPYCERVVRMLNELDLGTGRGTSSRCTPSATSSSASPARSVPAIVDPETGVTMSESANIVEYLESTYAEGGA